MTKEASKRVARTTTEIPFPWKDVMPPTIYNWLECLAKSHNTKEEFLFVGALAATAAIMGPLARVKVHETYQESMSLYVICIADPGSGKLRGFTLSIREPLSSLLMEERVK